MAMRDSERDGGLYAGERANGTTTDADKTEYDVVNVPPYF